MLAENMVENQPILITSSSSNQCYWPTAENYFQPTTGVQTQIESHASQPLSSFYQYNQFKSSNSFPASEETENGHLLPPPTRTGFTSELQNTETPLLTVPPNHSDEDSNSPQKFHTEFDASSNKENTCQKLAAAIKVPCPSFVSSHKSQPNPPKLSYTMDQLELLNAIYNEMKYPNSVQKTMIANIIGITRDQTKIWFQNRRRKDTLMAQGKIFPTLKRKSSGESEESVNNESITSTEISSFGSDGVSGKKGSVVEPEVIQKVLLNLRQYQNAPDRLSSKRTKRPKPEDLLSNDDLCTSEKPSQIKKVESAPSQMVLRPLDDLAPRATPISVNSSGSSSSHTSATSSSEDEPASYQSYTRPSPCFYELRQPVLINEYLANNSLKYPKLHSSQANYATTQPSTTPVYPTQTYARSIDQVDWSLYNYPRPDQSLNANQIGCYGQEAASSTSLPGNLNTGQVYYSTNQMTAPQQPPYTGHYSSAYFNQSSSHVYNQYNSFKYS